MQRDCHRLFRFTRSEANKFRQDRRRWTRCMAQTRPDHQHLIAGLAKRSPTFIMRRIDFEQWRLLSANTLDNRRNCRHNQMLDREARALALQLRCIRIVAASPLRCRWYRHVRVRSPYRAQTQNGFMQSPQRFPSSAFDRRLEQIGARECIRIVDGVIKGSSIIVEGLPPLTRGRGKVRRA